MRLGNGPLVNTMRTDAIRDPELREAADRLSDLSVGHEGCGTLSLPQLDWARDQFQALESGERTAFHEAELSDESIQKLKGAFEKLDRAFHTGRGLLNMVRRPALLAGSKRFQFVFEVPKDTPIERLVQMTEDTGLDRILVERKDGRKYLAVNKGFLGCVRKGANASLEHVERGKYPEVEVKYVHDVANGFWEGVVRYPRKLLRLVGHVMDHADYESSPIRKAGVSLGAVAATLGTLAGGATLVASLPTAALIFAGIVGVATAANAIAGHARAKGRLSNPCMILNAAGIQMAQKISLEALEKLDQELEAEEQAAEQTAQSPPATQAA